MADKTVAALNVAYFKKLIVTEIDESRLQVLRQLLAEEEAKLAQVREDKGTSV